MARYLSRDRGIRSESVVLLSGTTQCHGLIMPIPIDISRSIKNLAAVMVADILGSLSLEEIKQLTEELEIERRKRN
jgi:hypothetical protein